MTGPQPTTGTSSQASPPSGLDATVNPIPVEVPPPPGPLEREERQKYSTDGKRLDHSLRTWAGYGALGLVVLMYAAGMGAIGLFLGLWPCIVPRATHDMWHIVVATLVALFSVPTVLLLAVLRSASLHTKDEEMDSVHAAVGQKLMGMIEKWMDKR